MRARRHPILVAFSSLSILTERRLCNIAHVNERERPLWVKSGNVHNEPMMSVFHPIATKQRTRFYVGSVPILLQKSVRSSRRAKLRNIRI